MNFARWRRCTRGGGELDRADEATAVRQADDYLKQADELRRGEVVQAVFPKPDDGFESLTEVSG